MLFCELQRSVASFETEVLGRPSMCQHGMRQGKFRIQFDGGAETAYGLIQALQRFAVTCMQSLEINHVGSGIGAVTVSRFSDCLKPLLQRFRDLASYFVLYLKNVVQLEIVLFGENDFSL